MLQHQADGSALVRRAPALFFALMAGVLFLTGLSRPAESQTYNVIHNFTGKGGDGANPYGGPVLDRSGNLCGTTYVGGKYNDGSVYVLSPAAGSSWKYTSLYSFNYEFGGFTPGFGTLAIRDGAVYGTTESGGTFGVAFRVGPSAKGIQETVVHNFGNGTDGAEPTGGVVFDAAGNFYGTTLLGGTLGNGAVFEANPSGAERVIYSFMGGSDAVSPAAGVTLDADGNLYGTSSFGGDEGVGAIYKLSHSTSGWTESVLYSFQGLNDGEYPVAGVILDKAGNMYGGTFSGGANGGGTVYELSPSGESWTLTTLYSFTGAFGGPYNKLAFGPGGILYGATNSDGTYGHGSVFKLTPSDGNWTFTDLYDFQGNLDGGLIYGSVAVDANGNVFGTTDEGGSTNQGVIFEITP
ncbi:MAG TPA: choice-of-anchor tandem repeat GloVer-containing protein [Candidatus Sulfotelmatobacter sp.]|jgi:uncharacterized repeat protein (TIGR03803 family)